MVAVTVGDMNRCQVLGARRDQIYEDVRLLDGNKGVYEGSACSDREFPSVPVEAASLGLRSQLTMRARQGLVSAAHAATGANRGQLFFILYVGD
jgi:hypothetical protein